jgi:hypothetical protein
VERIPSFSPTNQRGDDGAVVKRLSELPMPHVGNGGAGNGELAERHVVIGRDRVGQNARPPAPATRGRIADATGGGVAERHEANVVTTGQPHFGFGRLALMLLCLEVAHHAHLLVVYICL